MITDFPAIFSGPSARNRLVYAKHSLVRYHCQERARWGHARKRVGKENPAKADSDAVDLMVSKLLV
jgi:hypothetical protein